jgi:hypothetical protein
MAYMLFGNLWLFVLNAYVGIFLLFIAAAMIPLTRSAVFLSRSTIVVFPLHPLIFSIFTGIAMLLFGAEHDFQNSLLWSLAYTVGAVILSVPVTFLMFAYLPFIFGRATASPPRRSN